MYQGITKLNNNFRFFNFFQTQFDISGGNYLNGQALFIITIFLRVILQLAMFKIEISLLNFTNKLRGELIVQGVCKF